MTPAPAPRAADDRPAPALPPGGGLLLVDKPSGCTSHDVVGRLRYVLRTRRIGHAGTLDPMATGLLVLAVDRSTKLLGHLALTDKTYLATIRLGQRTDTDDADGDVIATAPAAHLADAEIDDAISALTGPLMQVPSAVSAIKVQGRRAYDRVRAGETVDLAARPVTITRFDVVGPLRRSGGLIDIDVAVECTTGTYVRSLARDLGESLGVGGHLTRLRRTRVGPFDVADAVDVFGAADGAQVDAVQVDAVDVFGAADGAQVDAAQVDAAQVDALSADVVPTDAAAGDPASGNPAAGKPAADAGSTRRPGRRPAGPRPAVTEEFAARIAGSIVPAAEAVRTAFAVRTVDEALALDLQHGRTIPAAGLGGTYAAFDGAGEMVALVTETGGVARSVLGWRTG